MASLIRRVEDLVVEDGEVESKTKANGVCWGKIGLSDFGCVLVSFKRKIGGALSLVGNGELGEVSVVVTLPIVVSDQMIGFQRAVLHLVIEDL